MNIEDCPKGGVLGNNEPGTARLRTSHYRVVLADRDAAAARVLPYALMSAYAYRSGPACNDADNEARVTGARAGELKRLLAAIPDASTGWTEQPDLGMRDEKDAARIGCEDELGLLFHVWQRQVGKQTLVVIAFRGTSGSGDWAYGNLWWLTRFFLRDNQLARAQAHAGRVMAHFEQAATAKGEDRPRFVATGHSLGGGLAQHVLYAFPEQVEQAIVFDPSSVTGFIGVPQENRRKGCACRDELSPEARFIRVYQTYEILSNLRIFHKTFFGPERHVQELRFPFESSINPVERHSMQDFAAKLYDAGQARLRDGSKLNWFASKDPSCTAPLIERQKASCRIAVAPDAIGVCPR